MSDFETAQHRMQLLVLFIAGAPLWLIIYMAFPGEYTREEMYLLASIIGANIVWAVAFVALLLHGDRFVSPASTAIDAAREMWVSMDPNIVWYPWQAMVLFLVIGGVLMAVGLPKTVAKLNEETSSNDTYNEGDTDG